MTKRKSQRGLTFISLLILLAIGGFFVLLGLKLVPIYLENQSVRSVVKSLENDPLVRKSGPRDIQKLIIKRMKINSIYDFPREDIKIKKTRGHLKVDITYERVEPIIGNVSVLVDFSEKLEVDYIP